MDYQYRTKIAIWIVLLGLSFFYRWNLSREVSAPAENGKVAGATIEAREIDIDNFRMDIVSIPKKIKDGDPPVYAKSFVLIDDASKYPLFEKNARDPVPIASTTKIMTAIIAFENTEDLDQVITISKKAASQIGHTIGIRWDEKIKLNDLLRGLLIASGNGTAYAIAETVGDKFPGEGNPVEKFIAKMNEKARYLGLEQTKFKDPAGLDDTGHSSAFDLAILASYALRNEKIAEIVRTKETNICSQDNLICHNLKNSNRLVGEWDYPGAIGIKTGFTPEAGHCLVAAAERNGHRLISVILYTNEFTITASASESRKLLDWGFGNWRWD